MNLRESRTLLMMTSLALGVTVCLLLDASDAFAEGGASPGRTLWNNIMLWVNFGILVFFFVRYARKPLMAYLRSVRKKIEENLSGIKEEITGANSLYASESAKLKGIDQDLKAIRERILDIAGEERDWIVESGRIAAERMIENAKSYANHRLAMARNAIADELVDEAISLAEEKLRKGLSEDDNQRLIARFIKDLETSEGLLGRKEG